MLGEEIVNNLWPSSLPLDRFVSMLPKGVVFVVFCFLLRVVMAMGGAAADTASFAIIAGEFSSNIGTVTVRVDEISTVLWLLCLSVSNIT